MATSVDLHDLETTLTQDTPDALGHVLAQQALELTQLQRTHDEYVRSSCDYERELESEVARYEHKSSQLDHLVAHLTRERTALRQTLLDVHDELERVQGRDRRRQHEMHALQSKVQQLEQANDELETCVRIAHATIDDVQHQADALLEQNVLLQHEKEEWSEKERDEKAGKARKPVATFLDRVRRLRRCTMAG